MRCDKCGGDFDEKAEKYKTYKGIDVHHNPPQFLMDKWEGETYNLCRKCHRELHDEIIKILNQVAHTLKFNKNEYWVCQQMSPNEKEIAKQVVYDFTNRWLEKKDGDTKDIAAKGN